MSIWDNFLQPALVGILDKVVAILPNILAAALLLLVGWIISKAIDNLVSRLLNRFGFNKVAERAGIAGFLRNAGFAREPSWVIGKLIFWLLFLMFFLTAAETLNLTIIAQTLQTVVAFLPNMILVVFMVVFGALFGRFLGRLTRGAAAEAGVDMADFLGKLVNHLVIIMVVVIAINQLKVQSRVLEIALAAILGAFGLAVALTLGIGTRNIAQNIISGVYARKAFRVGQHMKLNNFEGEIVEIGSVNTTIRNKKELISVPNRAMIEEVTVRMKDSLTTG